MDQVIFRTLEKVRLSHGRSGLGYLTLRDSFQLLGEMRVIKSKHDIEIQARACELSSEAHVEVMKFVSPGKTERDIQGFFIYQIMKRGAAREGYGTIVAGGANACTLHYVFNDQTLQKDHLLLIDAGGEYCYQTADITRTYPISGQWNELQLQVYEGVLKIQKHLISMVKPGLKWSKLQEEAAQLLAELMLELGLLPGRVQDLIATGDYRKYYPHGVGHYLGLDVHDSGLYIDPNTGESRSLEPNMVLTIEPGLYIPPNDSSPYRGIGVRIEDNILVTESGCRNLTETCPKEPHDLCQLIGRGSSL
jgi:Xaa-Pro aminopeptidase